MSEPHTTGPVRYTRAQREAYWAQNRPRWEREWKLDEQAEVRAAGRKPMIFDPMRTGNERLQRKRAKARKA